MKMPSLYAALFLSAAFLAATLLCRLLTVAYVSSQASPYVDPLIGTWEIVWDADTKYEERLIVAFDRVSLRRFLGYVDDEGTVYFYDGDDCEYIGKLDESGDFAEGIYRNCTPYPDWQGVWQATRLSD
jgi:hypothetical protein